MVREYVEVSGRGSLQSVIARLEAVKNELPPGCSDADVRLRGDDVFGRHILVSYSRPETEEELQARKQAQAFVRSWFEGQERNAREPGAGQSNASAPAANTH
ncbi:MAG: hypothetical protein M3Q08_17375 [Pseudomonadota bacterium]|nr:hypothetical protein [Pseudomonadota bacterium]